MGIDAELCFLTTTELSESEVLNLASRLYEAFHGEPFYLWEDKHIIYPVAEHEQDGEPFLCPKGKFLYELSLGCRYYGKGYERGPLPTIINVCDWIEANISDAEIYYGGDSSGVLAEPFDKAARQTLLNYFYTKGHEPYQGLFGRGELPCICSRCKRPMYDVGGGGKYTFWSCGGCDEKAVGSNPLEPELRKRGHQNFVELMQIVCSH